MRKKNNFILTLCGKNVNFEFTSQKLKRTMISKCSDIPSNGNIAWNFKVKNVAVPYLKHGPVSFYRDKTNSNTIIKNGNIYCVSINDKNKIGKIETLRSPQAFLKACKAIFYYIGLREKCLFFHGASIARHKYCAYLFLGYSGMGKTTLCRHANKKWHIFSDEISVIMPKNNKFYVYQNNYFRPYDTKCDINSALIRKVFIISKGRDKNIFKKINRFCAFNDLIKHSFLPKNILDLNQEYFSSMSAFAKYCEVFKLKIFSFPGLLASL